MRKNTKNLAELKENMKEALKEVFQQEGKLNPSGKNRIQGTKMSQNHHHHHTLVTKTTRKIEGGNLRLSIPYFVLFRRKRDVNF